MFSLLLISGRNCGCWYHFYINCLIEFTHETIWAWWLLFWEVILNSVLLTDTGPWRYPILLRCVLILCVIQGVSLFKGSVSYQNHWHKTVLGHFSSSCNVYRISCFFHNIRNSHLLSPWFFSGGRLVSLLTVYQFCLCFQTPAFVVIHFPNGFLIFNCIDFLLWFLLLSVLIAVRSNCSSFPSFLRGDS